MTMFASFAGRCVKCGGAIFPGDSIEWIRGEGAWHRVCPPAAATPTVVNVTPSTVVPVDSSLIVKFLTDAKARGLKFPKVRFLAPSGGELRMSLAGGSTKYPGAVQVKVDGNWIGRIGADGVVTRGIDGALLAAIVKIAADPAAAAKAYGALMGHCSFCNLALTDEGSVEVGYGPVCAKSYGLPHKAKGSPHLVQHAATANINEKGDAL